MGYDSDDQDDIILGELDTVDGPTDEEADAAATEDLDDSQLSPEDGMRRRSAERRERRDRRRAGGAGRAARAEQRNDRSRGGASSRDARRAENDRKRARRRELNASSPDLGRGKRIAAIAVAVLLCVTLVAGGVYYFYFRGRNAGGSSQVAMTGPDANMDFGNVTIVSASGTTSIGMSLESFELNLSDVDLTIDEVYVSNRDEVEEHQPILKIDEDSIDTARIKLQQAAKSAEYAYQLNEVSAQEDVITAKDTYQQALIALEYAEQDYADTISEAQAEIDSLQRQVDEQQEKVDEYQSAVNDAEYYSKQYKVPEIKAQLQEDQALLQSIYDDDSNRVAEHLDYVYGGSYEAWLNDEEFTAESDSASDMGGDMGGGMPGFGDMGGFAPPGGGAGPGAGDGTGTDTGDGTGTDTGDGTGTGTGTDTGTGTGTGTDSGTSSGDGPGTGTGSDTSTGTGDSGTSSDTGDTGTSTDSSSTSAGDSGTTSDDGTSTTSETVSNEVTYAANIVTVGTLTADTAEEETTSVVVKNKVYYTEAPAGSSASTAATGSGTASASAGTATSGSASAATGSSSSASSSSSSASSSSSSSGATITDLYVGASSVDTSKALSTSSLSDEDLVAYPWYSAYVALSEEVTEEAQELETAESNAERDQSRAASLLSQAENKLKSLQLKLRTAQNDLITTTEEAQETLDTVKAEAAAAQETYNTSIRSIENSADTLKDAMDTADENLEAFEEQIGDGYLYTSNAGTIMMVGVEEGDTLTYNAMIAAYTDPGTISVTAAVDQSNIASISVADTVAVVFDEAGIYQGYVAAINPVTQSSSRTSVTYQVTVELQGDVSAVEENVSATVYFGDAVPLVFQQAGDQLHSPDTTDSSDDANDASSSSSTGSSNGSSSSDDDSALESMIEQADEDIADAEAAAEAGTTAADSDGDATGGAGDTGATNDASATGTTGDANSVASASTADAGATGTTSNVTSASTSDAGATGTASNVASGNVTTTAASGTTDNTAAATAAAAIDTTSEGQ